MAMCKEEYLKRYLSGPSNDKKKTKKKSAKTTSKQTGLKILDDDVDFKSLLPSNLKNSLDNDLADDKPVIVDLGLDDRPEKLRELERMRNDKRWRLVAQDDDESKSCQENQIKGNKKAVKDSDVRHSDSGANASPRQRNDRDASPGISPPRKRARADSDSDSDSPSQVVAIARDDVVNPVQNRHQDSKYFPERRHKKATKFDKSSHKAKHNSKDDSDNSPVRPDLGNRVRTRNDSDTDSNLSPRQRNFSQDDSDISPPRQKRNVRDEDNSPPRQRKNVTDEDNSPPRQRRNVTDKDNSPPRQKRSARDEDNSPPRQKRNVSDSDNSPPRRGKNSMASKDSFSKRTLHKVAVSGTEILPPHKKSRNALSTASPSRTEGIRKIGADDEQDITHPQVIYRKDGKKRNIEAEERAEEEEEAKRTVIAAKYKDWNKGLKQKELKNEQIADILHEVDKPLARYKDDQDLDLRLRDQERAGDPMLAFIKKKKANVTGAGRPRYKGPHPPPNRFNIEPGYRWDGVDRSNGFEKKIFSKLSDDKAKREIAHKWSVEDM